MNEPENELSPAESAAFASLHKQKLPPDFLEQRVVNGLTEAGLIKSPRLNRRQSLLRIGYAVAAGLVLFAGGAALGAWWKSAPVAIDNGPEFMLVLRSSRQEPATEPAIERQRVSEYRAWAIQTRRQGSLVAGEKLRDEARFLKAVNGQTSVSADGPETDKTVMGGYFLIKAQTYEQAITIAESCPHLKYGGTVEIRQLER